MNEMYWITRLDSIEFVGALFMMLGIIALIFYLIHIFSNIGMGDFADEYPVPKWVNRMCITFLFVGLAILTFVPTKKEAMLILGAGGILDYVESREGVGQLPDKCIQAIEKMADEYLSEEK